MLRRFFNRCWATATVFCVTAAPLWAKDEAAEQETRVWVLSYAIMIAFLTLTLFIILRPTKRSDSAFSFDELKAQKEEEMQKIKGSH